MSQHPKHDPQRRQPPLVPKGEKIWYAVIFFAVTAGFVYAKNVQPTFQEWEMQQARKIHCDIGMAPVDCVKRDQPQRGGKESKRSKVVR